MQLISTQKMFKTVFLNCFYKGSQRGVIPLPSTFPRKRTGNHLKVSFGYLPSTQRAGGSFKFPPIHNPEGGKGEAPNIIHYSRFLTPEPVDKIIMLQAEFKCLHLLDHPAHSAMN
jgi:hypothetical protein